ncbi:tripartite tricarboxylate transporter permease [Halomonas salifodinae]|uniref:tripartite tricarboxylate transporter permease n=1 Tax=Halomonas salifodinae TaxID=438745 RepID=UPI0033A7DE07
MGTLEALLLGLQDATQPTMLLYCFIGVFLGTLVGVLPGVGAMAAISLLLPITYYIPSTAALAMLAGVFYGSQYGGSIASILLNIPGTPASAVTSLDGYPMARQGRAGVALFIAMSASFVGSILGLLLLATLGPVLSEIGLSFGPAEYFSLMLLGLIAASAVGSGSAAKSLAMVVLGLLLGMVGTDINTGLVRFNFGMPELMDGINLVALAMGLFGLSEVIASMRLSGGERRTPSFSLRSMLPEWLDLRRAVPAMLRGTAIGSFFGTMPGTASGLSPFMSYAVEKKLAREPERFGKGAVEGIAGAESSNSSGAMTAFVPTLTLGIPGDVVMALMLGAMMLHGIQPGPLMISENPVMFWSLVVSFGIGNLLLLVLNMPLIGLWTALLRIPFSMLYPAIIIFICLGVYSVNNNVFDVYVVAAIGVLGYGMSLLNFSPAPLLLGFVLGPLLEENLRRALLLSRGDPMTFIERPVSAGLLAVCLALLLWAAVSAIRGLCRQAHARRGGRVAP